MFSSCRAVIYRIEMDATDCTRELMSIFPLDANDDDDASDGDDGDNSVLITCADHITMKLAIVADNYELLTTDVTFYDCTVHSSYAILF